MSPELYNSLGETLITSESQAKLDECCKALLAEKQFLAWILQSCEDAYKDKSIDEIIDCIEGEPEIGTVPVGEGLENKYTAEKISGMSTEDASKYEGIIRYDIRFRSRLLGEKESELIVNVESQNNFNPGYRLVTRGLYYTGRMISSQKGAEFHHSDYSKLKKVHSIWICLHPDRQWRGKINTYQIQEKHLLGSVSEDKNAYDKIQVTLICLDDKSDNKEKNVVSLLNIALDDEVSAKKKLELLKENFHIRTTERLGREVSNMCNYSEGVLQKGIQKGLEQGIERGLKKGLEQGIEQERKNSIITLISTLIELCNDEDIIIKKVTEKYNISTELAKEFYSECIQNH